MGNNNSILTIYDLNHVNSEILHNLFFGNFLQSSQTTSQLENFFKQKVFKQDANVAKTISSVNCAEENSSKTQNNNREERCDTTSHNSTEYYISKDDLYLSR